MHAGVQPYCPESPLEALGLMGPYLNNDAVGRLCVASICYHEFKHKFPRATADTDLSSFGWSDVSQAAAHKLRLRRLVAEAS